MGVDIARLKADAEASRSYLLGEMPEARLDGTWHPTLVTA